MARVLLLTGPPGSGKTTVVERVVAELAQGIQVAGFVSRALMQNDVRVGFELVPLGGGDRRIMAHCDLVSSHRVGRYGVDVEMINYMVDTTLSATSRPALFVIDEIGRMECFSPSFERAIRRILAGDRPVLATVALKGGGLIAEVKEAAAEIIEVSGANRDALPQQIEARILSWSDERRA